MLWRICVFSIHHIFVASVKNYYNFVKIDLWNKKSFRKLLKTGQKTHGG